MFIAILNMIYNILLHPYRTLRYIVVCILPKRKWSDSVLVLHIYFFFSHTYRLHYLLH